MNLYIKQKLFLVFMMLMAAPRIPETIHLLLCEQTFTPKDDSWMVVIFLIIGSYAIKKLPKDE